MQTVKSASLHGPPRPLGLRMLGPWTPPARRLLTVRLRPPSQRGMSNHTHRPSHPKQKRPNRSLPRGRAKLVALQVAYRVVSGVRQLQLRGEAHLRDHLVRASRNTALALSEASGHTGGNRRVHLERAYGETQEIKSDIDMLVACGVEVPDELVGLADRLGGLVYGLLRSFTVGVEDGRRNPQ